MTAKKPISFFAARPRRSEEEVITMKRAKFLLVALAALLLTLPAAAQTRPYRLTEQQMKNLLERIENQADRLQHSIDDALDESTADGTRLEDQMNDFFKNF